jgi:hypothetical protein
MELLYIIVLWKEIKTVMVNNSTDINITNNHLSPQTTKRQRPMVLEIPTRILSLFRVSSYMKMLILCMFNFATFVLLINQTVL